MGDKNTLPVPADAPTGALVPASLETLAAPPPALLAVYEPLPGDVVNHCERHRSAIIRDELEHLRAVRDALAPYGAFQAWCDAAGIKSAHARYILDHDNWLPSAEPITGSVTADVLQATMDAADDAPGDRDMGLGLSADDVDIEPAPLTKAAVRRLRAQVQAQCGDFISALDTVMRTEHLAARSELAYFINGWARHMPEEEWSALRPRLRRLANHLLHITSEEMNRVVDTK
jgi:hypothetical protein